MFVRQLVLGSVSSVVLLLSSCGGKSDLAPVSGLVTIDGKPLAKATVTFSPAEGKDLTVSLGTTDSQGRFTLRTADGQLGAVPGTHNVSIANSLDVKPGESLPDDRSQWPKAENPVPEKYLDVTKPALTFNVPPKGTDAANLELKSK